MKRRYLIFFLVLLTVSIACGGKTRPTPTPFAEGDATEEALNAATPLAISITDLAADPEAYADSFLEISGHYRRRALLVCDSDPHPAPATWQLEAADGSMVAVGGFDSQVRSLLPNNLTMTVVGVWQLFEGPVGCGKSATNSQIWYLKASDILSPSPIARVTLTPTGSGAQIAGEGESGTAVSDSGNNGSSGPTPTFTDDGEPPLGTPTLPSTTVPSNGTPSIAPTDDRSGSNATSTPSPPSNGSGATVTPTLGAGTTSPTATSSNSEPTVAATNSGSGSGGDPTPTNSALTTATPNANNFDTIEFEDLSPEQPVLELLEAEQAHLYPISFEYNGAITITAVGESTMNLVLEIIDPSNAIVQQANKGGDGELEAIVDARLNVALDYQIRLYNLNAVGGNYCLIFSEAGGFPDSIKGRIEYGQTKTTQIEEFAINYWCFLGSNGDTVSISVAPASSTGDFVLGLYGPPDFDAIGSPYSSAMITNTSLPDTGMFIIGILNDEIDASSYSLTLTKN